MARNNDRDRGSKRTLKDTRPRGKSKVCIFCKDHATWVDYKDVNLLGRFMSDRGKIRSRRVTGNCLQHQRDLQVAVKTAREVALLPYTQRTVNERGPGRGPGRGRRRDQFRTEGTGGASSEEGSEYVVEDIHVDEDEAKGDSYGAEESGAAEAELQDEEV
jgi:small subunit ribosomal protein S18